MQQLIDQKNKKEEPTPSKVTKLGNSFPNISLEELSLQTKSVTKFTTNFGIDTRKLCQVKSHSEWQVIAFDDSWSFLCGPCGLKLSEKLNKKNNFQISFFVASYLQLTIPKPNKLFYFFKKWRYQKKLYNLGISFNFYQRH